MLKFISGGYQVDPAPFIERPVRSPQPWVSSCHKTWHNFWILTFVPRSIVYPCTSTTLFTLHQSFNVLVSDSINPPGLLFFKIALSILSPLRFHKLFRISLLFSTKKDLLGCEWERFDTVYQYGENWELYNTEVPRHAYSITLYLHFLSFISWGFIMLWRFQYGGFAFILWDWFLDIQHFLLLS